MKKTALLYNTEYNAMAMEVSNELKDDKHFIAMTKL